MPKRAYIVNERESLMDVAVLLYGDVTGMFLLQKDNASIDVMTANLEAGQVLYYDDTVDLTDKSALPLPAKMRQKGTMKRYIVTNEQLLMDVAIEVYGDITGVLRLIEDNSALLTIDAPIFAGQELIYYTDYSVNADVVRYYSDRQLRVSTGEYQAADEWLILTGAWNDAGIWVDEENWID